MMEYSFCKHPDSPILIVDDAEEQIQLLSYFLRKSGYKNIKSCTNSSNAVDLYLSGDFDVFLLDYLMPDVSGIDIVTELAKKNHSYLPIIMLTAESDPEIKYQALSLGVQDFIAKPFDKFEVLARINTIVGTSVLHKRLKKENIYLDQKYSHTQSQLNDEIRVRTHIETKLQHNLWHDSLTGLPNKLIFNDRINQGVEYCKRNGTKLSVILMNIENIKTINNTLGHQYGDQVLKIISQRISDDTRAFDPVIHVSDESLNVARLSGNSFIIGLMDLGSSDEVIDIYNRMIKIVSQPYRLDDIVIEPSIFSGIVHYPDHGLNADDLIQHADIAAYEAKQKNQKYSIYSPEHDKFTRMNLELMHDLKDAITQDQLSMYLQPKINLKNHQISGYEALLRWNHAQHGFIPPDRFVCLAEEMGQINQLTSWVINHSINLSKNLHENDLTNNLSLNITATDLLDQTIIKQLLDLNLHENSAKITLEITEGSMISDPVRVRDTIKQLSDAGFNLSIDDFGTGYSSLAYLQKLEVHELKIDKSFVMDLNTNIDNQMIVRSIIDIAHHLNLAVVAEGVENQESYDLLVSFGCDYVQGFHLSKPLPFAELPKFVEKYASKLLRNTGTGY